MAKKQKYIAASVFSAGGREYKPGELAKLTEEDTALYLSTGMIYEEPDKAEITSQEDIIKEKDEKIKELEKENRELKAKIAETTETAAQSEEEPENDDVVTK